MNMFFFYLILSLFLLLSFLIGRESSKQAKDSQDYLLGGRNVKLWSLTLTLLATQLGGGVILGTLEASYHYGFYSLLYGLGLSLGLVILALGLGARFRRLEVSTVTEIFETVYGSKQLRQISALISMLSLFLILVAICVSSEKLFISLGFQSKIVFLLLWMATSYYTIMGGFKAVVKTDGIQISYILFVFSLLASFFFLQSDTFSSEDLKLFTNSSKEIPLLSWLISPLFFVLIGQDMGQRCFSAQTEKTVSKACLIAGILLFLSSWVPAFLGIAIKSAGLVPSAEEPLLLLSLKVINNPMIGSLFIVAVLMAILSTADSLLCAITSHASEDFTFTQSKDQKQKLFYAKAITFSVSFFTLVFASFSDGIISLMILAYELCISTLFVPIVCAVLLKNPSKEKAKASMIVGLLAFLGFKFIDSFSGSELIPVVLSALAFGLTPRKKF